MLEYWPHSAYPQYVRRALRSNRIAGARDLPLVAFSELSLRLFSSASGFENAAEYSQLGIAAAWIAFAVTGLGDVPFYHHEIRILFFTLLALTHLLYLSFRPQRPP